MWTQQFVYTVAHYVDLKGYLYNGAPCRLMSVHYTCNYIGTVGSPFRMLLVPECCVIKLACPVADNMVSFLCHGWIVL